MENGIIGRFEAARLVVALVDLQSALQSFQRALDRHHLMTVAGVKTQRVHLVHLNGEVFVGKETVFGVELEHSSQNAARKLEITVFLQYDTVVVGHDDHLFAVAQGNGGIFDAIQLRGQAEDKHIVGVQVYTDVRLAVFRERLQFDDIEIDAVTRGIKHIEIARQHGHPLALNVIFHKALGLKPQNQRKHLLNRETDERGKVAKRKTELTFHIVETAQETLQAHHGMDGVETLKFFELVEPEIID